MITFEKQAHSKKSKKKQSHSNAGSRSNNNEVNHDHHQMMSQTRHPLEDYYQFDQQVLPPPRPYTQGQ